METTHLLTVQELAYVTIKSSDTGLTQPQVNCERGMQYLTLLLNVYVHSIIIVGS